MGDRARPVIPRCMRLHVMSMFSTDAVVKVVRGAPTAVGSGAKMSMRKSQGVIW